MTVPPDSPPPPSWPRPLAIALALVLWSAWLAPLLVRAAGAGAAAMLVLQLAAALGAAAMLRRRPRAPAAGCDCHAHLLALAEDLPVGIVLLEQGRVAHANAAAGRQLGCVPATLAGRPATDLFADAAAAAGLLEADGPRETRLDLRRIDGGRVPAEVGVRTLCLAHRRMRLLFACDLSERQRIQAELERQREELQAMARRLLTVQEDERATLSRELHDDVGQQITALKLGVLALQGEDDAQRREETTAELLAIADQTVAKLRNLSLLLRPPQLDALGLEAALRWQAGVLFRSGRPRLVLEIAPLDARPAPEVELACFRIAQEALTNALRHADADEVRLSLRAGDGRLALEVLDDGHGLRHGGQPSGLGMITMRERAELVGGHLDVGAGPDGGTRVHAALPMRLPT